MSSEALQPKRSSLSDGTVLVVATIVATLVVWWVLVVGFRALLGVGTTGDPAIVEAMQEGVAQDVVWREQIARNPTQIRPYRKLAQALERQGKQEEAAAAIEQALRLDPTHPGVLWDAGDFYLRTGKAERALPIFRRVADLYASLREDVWPIFDTELESSRGNEFVLRMAIESPVWWPTYFRHACDAAKHTDVLAKVFVVRADAGVLTNSERVCLIGRMQREGRWAGARELWLNSLPMEQRQRAGNVFNGNFEWPLSNFGFDWIVQGQDTTIAEIEPIDIAAGTRALRLTFTNTRYVGPPLLQYLMLRRGRYRLEGNERADGLESWPGLQWGVYCQQERGAVARQLAKTEPLAGSGAWREFQKEFSVPTDCEVQVLRLELANPRRDANTPGDVAARLRGGAWYHDLTITTLD